MTPKHEDTRPPHQRIFPSDLIAKSVEAYTESYQMHSCGTRWAIHVTLELVASGLLDRAIAEDTLLACLQATKEAIQLYCFTATLSAFNKASTTDEFLHALGHALAEASANDIAERRMKLLLLSLHDEWDKLHPKKEHDNHE